MARYIACLALALLIGEPLRAGELDAEFATKASPAPAVQKGTVVPTQPAMVLQVPATAPKASELDSEAPADAVRGGWRGGWGGWRGGWGGWRGGWGWGGWGRGWTVGWRGGWWGWPGGWWGWRGGWGWPGWGWGWGWGGPRVVLASPGWGVCW
jgi:hypothetical protein